jgi:hypothetical protein
MAGDFNLILSPEDKNNENINRAMMGRFRRLVSDLELKDIPLMGRRYTWSNGRDNPTLVKLDLVLCTVDWEVIFPECFLQSQATEFLIIARWSSISVRVLSPSVVFTSRIFGASSQGFWRQ